MSVVGGDGQKIIVRGGCVLTPLVRAYLRRAASPHERTIRARNLAAYAAHDVLGLSVTDAARAVGLVRGNLSPLLPEVRSELREIAEQLGIAGPFDPPAAGAA